MKEIVLELLRAKNFVELYMFSQMFSQMITRSKHLEPHVIQCDARSKFPHNHVRINQQQSFNIFRVNSGLQFNALVTMQSLQQRRKGYRHERKRREKDVNKEQAQAQNPTSSPNQIRFHRRRKSRAQFRPWWMHE